MGELEALKVVVSEWALVQRINYRLKRESEVLKGRSYVLGDGWSCT